MTSSNTPKPISWCISASDCSAHAGIQADLSTFQDLNVHGCSIVTAITAQNSMLLDGVFASEPEAIAAQFNALEQDLTPRSIKIGLIPDNRVSDVLMDKLSGLNVPIIFDPVMKTSTGKDVGIGKDELLKWLPKITLITPNIPETEALLNRKITSTEELKMAADAFHALGASAVLIKGGHSHDPKHCFDYFSVDDEVTGHWLQQKRLKTDNSRGTGCTLSSAIASFIALDENLYDAVTLANAYIHNGIVKAVQYGQGPGPVAKTGFPNQIDSFPKVFDRLDQNNNVSFPDCGTEPLGLYPVVDSVEWLEKLLPLGITTAQLRIKGIEGDALESTIKSAIEVGKRFNCRLFINDYWQLAIKHNAYGVHLGQEDLYTADLDKIHKAKLRLGLSTHGDFEWSRAATYQPSYTAIGAIFPTDTKEVKIVGTDKLNRWVQLLQSHYPLTAIGGINKKNIRQVLNTGVKSVAVVSAITASSDYELATKQLQSILNI